MVYTSKRRTIITLLAFLALSLTMYTVILSRVHSSAESLPRDCEATSIIHCGSLTVDELKSDYASNDGGRYSDIPAVFSSFSISAQDINTISATRGIVKADGTVWIGNKMIGKNAVTAGRVDKPGSVPIPGTSAYKRPPSASFATSNTSIDAMIGYKNGQPAFAILSSCGNPVTWETPGVPNLEITKNIRSADNTNWVESDSFTRDSVLTYRISIRNVGNADAANIVVKDQMPQSNSFIVGSMQRSDVSADTSGDTLTSTGYKIDKIAAGQEVTMTLRAIIVLTNEQCGDVTFTNKVTVTADVTGTKEDTAGGKISLSCASAVRCVSITSSNTSPKIGDSVTYTIGSELSNATLGSYEFRVNDMPVQNTISPTFVYRPTTEGSYTVKAIVKTDKGDATSAACESAFTIAPPTITTVATPVSPPSAPSLPNTGAKSVVLAFFSATTLGTIMYRILLLRRMR